MANKKIILTKAILLLFAFLISGCTFTTHTIKHPQFKIDLDEMAKNLQALLSFEHVNVDGMETTTNGKSSSELEADILNATTVSSDDSTLSILRKNIAKQLKEALKDPNAFNTYKILFVTKETDGAITKTSSKGNVFKSEDL